MLACTNSPAGTCTSPATAVAYTYDPVGRTANFWSCDPSNCGTSTIYSAQYTYGLAGDVISWQHPGNFTLTNTVQKAQRVAAVQSSWQNSSHPQYLANNITYTPWGAVSTLQDGCAGSGCWMQSDIYTSNKRLWPARVQGAGGCWVYNYYTDVGNPSSCAAPGQGSHNNGSVMGYYFNGSEGPLANAGAYQYDSLIAWEKGVRYLLCSGMMC